MNKRVLVGRVICARLAEKLLPAEGSGPDWRRLPNGEEIMIGSEWVYATSDRPQPCPLDLGEPIGVFILWE
jgi:hypothetical protein